MIVRSLAALLLVVTVGMAGAHSPRATAGLDGLRVAGNQIVNHAGRAIHLRGVNRSGTEYACIQGWGIFDGPSNAASVAAIASWHVNIVRVPLNEDCWLGINRGSLPAAYYGANYVRAVEAYVKLLHEHGMYAELSLIWAAPGKYQATYQPGGPDEDHSPAMWASMAKAFAHDPNVILAPWGETITGWSCFMRTGCDNQATYGPDNKGYETAPMRQAVATMRAAGYKGIISIPCIDYANQCTAYDGSSWLKSHPADPLHQLVAEAHVYGNNACGAQNAGACLEPQYGLLAKSFPVIWGETGETYDDSECTSRNMKVLLPWADRHISGYMAWTWDTWGDCLALIKNYDQPLPSDPYAAYIHSHYASSTG